MPSGEPGEFFTWTEMTRSATATKRGLSNNPDLQQRVNLKMLCSTVLDPLRRHLGRPVSVTSGFRSDAVNEAVGGSKSSAHRKGLAADIEVKGLDAHAVMQAVLECDCEFDQAIAYAPSRGGHVHLGLATGRQRGQQLWAPASGGYEPYNPFCD
ncbi:MAG: peptidase M15 [Actinomycetia bacterium]|nr:peptidase M15 [Actinomycetes bacterium]